MFYVRDVKTAHKMYFVSASNGLWVLKTMARVTGLDAPAEVRVSLTRDEIEWMARIVSEEGGDVMVEKEE